MPNQTSIEEEAIVSNSLQKQGKLRFSYDVHALIQSMALDPPRLYSSADELVSCGNERGIAAFAIGCCEHASLWRYGLKDLKVTSVASGY